MERKISGKKCVSTRPRQSRKRPGCIRLFVCPTTGGRLEISVSPRESILGLKAALARKLRTNPARITLIYKEKVLTSGRLVDNQILEDSHLTLLPNMESGLSLHQSEKSITQALENLSESQVNDFLSGRAPLMLAIRMGGHMVFVQLQLSTLQGQGCSQPRPSVTPMSPTSAALLSQSGLSASALAQATRCLSKKIHRLQGIAQPNSMHPTAGEAQGVSLSPAPGGSSSSSSARLSQRLSVPTATEPRQATSTTVSMPRKTATTAGKPPISPLPPFLPLASSNPSPLPVHSATPSPSPPSSPGAVIDSMKHVGSGVYSGTFSGTLDPSLQDTNGQPRRSVNTILHILNDLLVAAPNSPVIGPNQSLSYATSKPLHTAINQNGHLTPPPSPKMVDKSGHYAQENSDNILLRGKMQRLQMMMAQRKEQRRKRRQVTAPYTPLKSLTSVASSSSTSVQTEAVNSEEVHLTSTPTTPTVLASECPSQTSSASERPRICSHVEESSEGCSSYCKASLEQDSVVV